MQNYNIILETITNRILGNFIWMLIGGLILTYIIVLLIKGWRKIKEKKYVKMDMYFMQIGVCLVLLSFIIFFGIYMSINLSTRIALIEDKQEQQICNKEITLGYSSFSSKHITFVVDKNNEEDKYYFIDYLPGIDKIDINQGDRYIISYYKYSKVICDIEIIN